jgi:hypothetical protein
MPIKRHKTIKTTRKMVEARTKKKALAVLAAGRKAAEAKRRKKVALPDRDDD